MDIRPSRVAAYIRWSTDEQASGTTLDVQRDACRHYVQSQGWRWNDDLLYVDDGHSGATLDRPAMRRLRDAVRRADVDCVVVYKIDRLSRNIVDATHLVLREWKERCHLKSVLEPIDTTTDLGRMIFGILAMFADFERATIRDRTQGGKLRRIALGEQMHGRPAYGYLLHPQRRGRWVEDAEKAPIVRRMFRLVADGMTANQVVRLLNAEDVRTPRGKRWTVPSVLHILHNRTYTGVVEYGRTSLIKQEAADTPDGRARRIRVRHGAPRISRPTQALPALVASETFERVQDALSANRARFQAVGGRAMASKHLLVGLAQCGCGTPLAFKRSSSRYPQHRSYYTCPRHPAGTCDQGGSIPALELETMLEQEFLRLFGVRQVRTEIFARRVAAVDGDRAAVDAALEGARREMRRLGEEDARILRAARAGEVPFAALDDLRESLRRDRVDADRRLRGLEEQRDRVAGKVRSVEATLEASDAVAHWNTLEVWQRRQLMRMCLRSKVVVTKSAGRGEITVQAPWLVGG